MERAQAHTLEGIIAGIVLLSGLLFSLQATAVTPLSASTSSQHIENQLYASAEGVLAVAADESTGDPSMLKRAVLFWDPGTGTGEFHDATNGDFYTDFPAGGSQPNRFVLLLDRTLESQGIAYNVHVAYQQSNGRLVRQRMIYRGEPSDNAVTASRLVTLYDDDRLYAPDSDDDDLEEPTAITVNRFDFYVPDAVDDTATDESDSIVYNVVEVEVTLWRM